jgi:O-acetyl-ADP-ribose deacetylase (regulator of RNase III)
MPEVIKHTINSFLAAKAALIEALKLNLNSIVFPGLGTGTGLMSPKNCAKQVSAAIRYVIIEKRHTGSYLYKDIYDEQLFIRDNVVDQDWLKVQTDY